jgi:hypothetical protein
MTVELMCGINRKNDMDYEPKLRNFRRVSVKGVVKYMAPVTDTLKLAEKLGVSAIEIVPVKIKGKPAFMAYDQYGYRHGRCNGMASAWMRGPLKVYGDVILFEAV